MGWGAYGTAMVVYAASNACPCTAMMHAPSREDAGLAMRSVTISGMLSLAIDTSTLAGSVAILDEERVLGTVGMAVEETHGSRLFRHVRFLLAEMRLELGQFDLYSVAAGPGSFTGLRVGLAAVMGWAEGFGKPVAAVSGLEAVAARCTTPGMLLAPVLDARRGQVYGAVYERQGAALTRQGEEVVLAPGEFLAWLAARVGSEAPVLVTPSPEVFARDPATAGRPAWDSWPVERVSPLLAETIGRLGYQRARRGELFNSLTLDANYVRRPDAELNWKG